MINLGGASQIASLFVKIGADSRQFENAMGGVERRLGGVGGAITKFGAIAGAVAIGGLTAIGVGMTAALKSSAEFDKTISGVGAVLNATTEEMTALSDAAMRIGKDTAFSASEAASAMEMLAKNGMNTTQILEGAADATIALAAATGSNLNTAADVATSAMLQFGLTTEQMGKAINGITGVVVASKFGIEDYALAIAQGGGAAAAFGVSFEDFNAVLTATSTAFASGSDAGTSFKTFMARLVPQSKEATEAMARLGIITAEGVNTFFDASGQMKSMADIAGVLNGAFSGLSDAAKLDYMTTIFGPDAFRMANKLSEVGSQGILAALDAISKVDAADQAARRLDNLAGDVEQLGDSFDTLKIKMVKAFTFTPLARRGVQWLTKGINKLLDMDFDKFADAVSDGIGKIGKVAQNVGGIVDWLFAGFARIRNIAGDFLRPFAGPLSELFAQLQGGFANGFDTMNLSGPVNGLLTALIDAWLRMQRWMTETALPGLLTALGTWGAALVEWVAPRVPGVLAELGAMFGSLLAWVVGVAPNIWAKLTEWGAAFVGWIRPMIPALLEKLGEWSAAFVSWAVGLWPLLVTKFSDFWTKGLLPWFTDGEKRSQIVTKLGEWGAAFGDWAGALWGNLSAKLGEMWGDFKEWITDPAKQAELRDSIAEKWQGFTEWAGGVWGDVQPKLLEFSDSVRKWIGDNVPSLAAWLDSFLAFSAQIKTDFLTEWPKIVDTFQTNSTLIVGHIQNIIDKLQQLASWPSSAGVEMGVNFAKIFNGVQTVLFAAVLSITSAIDLLITATNGAVQAMEQLKQGNFSGWVQSWGQTMAEMNSAIAALQNSALGNISQWIDPLFWLGLRPESTGGTGDSGGFGGSRMGSRSGGGTVNINISGDGSALPADRSKLRELARAIWRESELAGIRL